MRTMIFSLLMMSLAACESGTIPAPPHNEPGKVGDRGSVPPPSGERQDPPLDASVPFPPERPDLAVEPPPDMAHPRLPPPDMALAPPADMALAPVQHGCGYILTCSTSTCEKTLDAHAQLLLGTARSCTRNWCGGYPSGNQVCDGAKVSSAACTQCWNNTSAGGGPVNFGSCSPTSAPECGQCADQWGECALDCLSDEDCKGFVDATHCRQRVCTSAAP